MIWLSFLLAFTALLPLINPVGSALIFLGLVGDESAAVYRHLAGKIAIATVVFLLVIEFLGSLLLSFFGISLPIVQVTGGIIIAATAWSLLFENDASVNTRKKNEEIAGSRFRRRRRSRWKGFLSLHLPYHRRSRNVGGDAHPERARIE